MKDVLVIGSATRDLFFEGVPFVEVKTNKFKVGKGIALPYAGKVKVPKITFTIGGGGANVAVTFARQGYDTTCISCVGDDGSGREIIDKLINEKIDAKYFQISKKDITAYSTIFLDNKGERTILSHKGAGDEISEKEIPWGGKIKANWMYLSSLAGNKNLLMKAVNFAAKNKMFLATNPGMGELKNFRLMPRLLKRFDVFVLNQEEASYLADVPYKDEKKLFRRLDDLIEGLVVMTKGPKGLTISDGKHMWQVGTYKEKKVVDRTGAGDSFASGFVSAFVGKKLKKVGNRSVFEEKDIEEAIKLGSANATSVVEHVGAQTGILRKDDFKDKRWDDLSIKKIEII
ncbi:MAG TPA: carbohydrate kinase family protein [Candidatus Paceibacterota bacterium]|nr:carbohydrate kinase family protein [Candidatus Paceibacterota bacterium]HPT40229.1 carbohydrate kinase family protein [Candidatus Paceibacterota bacterium]